MSGMIHPTLAEEAANAIAPRKESLLPRPDVNTQPSVNSLELALTAGLNPIDARLVRTANKTDDFREKAKQTSSQRRMVKAFDVTKDEQEKPVSESDGEYEYVYEYENDVCFQVMLAVCLVAVAAALYMLVKLHFAPNPAPEGPQQPQPVPRAKQVQRHWLAKATGMSNKHLGVGATAVAGLAALGVGAYYESELNKKRRKAGKPLLPKSYALYLGTVVTATVAGVYFFWDRITRLFGYRSQKERGPPPTNPNPAMQNAPAGQPGPGGVKQEVANGVPPAAKAPAPTNAQPTANPAPAQQA